MEGGRTRQTCERNAKRREARDAGVAAPMTCLLAVRRVRADDGGVVRRHLRRERVHRRPELAAHRSSGRARASRSARNDERTGGLPNRPRARGALREGAESARASARPTAPTTTTGTGIELPPSRRVSRRGVARNAAPAAPISRFWLFRGLRQLARRDSNRGAVSFSHCHARRRRRPAVMRQPLLASAPRPPQGPVRRHESVYW